MATVRAARAEQTRQSLLATAQRLFDELGYDATSLQMIADEMGVTKAAVYYHYRTKVEILQELAGRVIAELNAVMDEAESLPSRQQRVALLMRVRVEQLLSKRDTVSIRRHDPGIHRELESSQAMDDLLSRGLRLLFGPAPSPADRAAYALFLCLDATSPYLSGLSTAELREALQRTSCRLLGIRYPGGGATA